ncbi:MAG: helix-turn-helix transcriptional regulator [Clostridia bacterium]|nr:helix-turn-helix transcriptional regulator [Clostridia bacterium]
MQVYEINKRIDELREIRGWTLYKLAEEAGLTQSTLFNMRTRGTLPSITTLSCICNAFGITLSEFFTTGEDETELTAYEKRMLQNFRRLSVKNKAAVSELVEKLI